MLRKLWMCRALGSILSVVILFQPLAAAAKEECLDADYVKGAAIGGILGTGAGIATAAAVTGTAVTITATGASAGAVGAAIAIDCATTMCIGTVVAGTLIGIGVGLAWLFSSDPENCAGTIYYSPKKKAFTMSWDRDSNDEAIKDGKRYCERTHSGTCEPIVLFRKCAAVAQDYGNRAWAAGTDSTAKAAERRALNECKENGGKNCKITLTAACNSD